MSEEDFKTAVNNMLMLQNNNDHNFQILQAQIDNLQRQLDQLNDLKEMFRLPKPENKDRKAFDEVWAWYDGPVSPHRRVGGLHLWWLYHNLFYWSTRQAPA